MYFLTLLFTVSTILVWPRIAGQLRECTAQEAAVGGHFKCLPGCDDNHGEGTSNKYCLSYFPNDGQCYLKPYSREDVLTCNDQVSSSTAPMWLVFVGGSNQYMMLKVMLDVLLELPGDAGYHPAEYYGAQRKTLSHPFVIMTDGPFIFCTHFAYIAYEATGQQLYSEFAVMDFIWDADHNLLKKTAWWWDADCYYCLPNNTQQIFLEVPAPSQGSFRVSYISLHTATDFPQRFDLVVDPDSSWMSLNPTVHVYEEWSGHWGDEDTPQSVHEANIQHLNDRRADGET
jgi:hypothetical protein